MSYQQNNFAQRTMIQGDWTCAGCGTSIKELPFNPTGNRPIYCKDCHRNSKPSNGGGSRGGSSFGAPRQMIQGNWECADCGVEINELPFRPDGRRPVLCSGCHKKN